MKTGVVVSFILVMILSITAQQVLAQVDYGDILRFQQQVLQMKERTEYVLSRPSPQERSELKKLLALPVGKLEQADREFLTKIQKQAVWLGWEHRIMHEIWSEAFAKTWEVPKADQQPTVPGPQ